MPLPDLAHALTQLLKPVFFCPFHTHATLLPRLGTNPATSQRSPMTSPFGHFIEQSLGIHLLSPYTHTSAPRCELSPGTPSWCCCTRTNHPCRGRVSTRAAGILTSTLWAVAKPLSQTPSATPMACLLRHHRIPPPPRHPSPALALTTSRWTGNARVPLANAHESLTCASTSAPRARNAGPRAHTARCC